MINVERLTFILNLPKRVTLGTKYQGTRFGFCGVASAEAEALSCAMGVILLDAFGLGRCLSNSGCA